MGAGRRINKSVLLRCFAVVPLLTGGWFGLRSWSNKPMVAHGKQAPNRCKETSRNALRACRQAAQSDYSLALARCDNSSTTAERTVCRKQAREDLKAAIEDCKAQNDARQEVCAELGRAPYDPVLDPSNFVSIIDNPFFPLTPGTTLVYEGTTAGGLEHDEVAATTNTVVILGVTCLEVRDTSMVDGVVSEDTLDWFAQDKDGNVWYFGELSQQFEGGKLAGLEGSWKAGEEGAKPGIVMEAHPAVGDIYRQEFSVGVAEDLAEVLALNESVTVTLDTFVGCLKTREFSPLSPDEQENKFFAPGVGFILSIDLETGERQELIEIRT